MSSTETCVVEREDWSFEIRDSGVMPDVEASREAAVSVGAAMGVEQRRGVEVNEREKVRMGVLRVRRV